MKNYLGIGLVLVLLVVVGIAWQRPNRPLGGVTQGQEYFATSTGRAQADFANYSVIQAPFALNPAGTRVATSVPTVLGSVVISQTGTSGMCFYDATTTVTNAENATSTMWSACFPASMTVGTYVFDIQLKHGILVEYTSGQPTGNSRASTTITFR